MRFLDKLSFAMDRNDSLVCVGLDTDSNIVQDDQFAFNKRIIDATNDLVCAYKINSAFYEAGHIDEMKKTCDYIAQTYPHLPIIIDAKRGDVSHTNQQYATFAFDYIKADAITLHPYLGEDSLRPFLERSDKGCIILCRTSNLGSEEFQDLMIDGKPLYQHVAEHVAGWHKRYGNCLLVVGATFPEELNHVRQIVGDMTLLVPGIGVQGGEVQRVVASGITRDKKGRLIISASRSILEASDPRSATMSLREEINIYRSTI